MNSLGNSYKYRLGAIGEQQGPEQVAQLLSTLVLPWILHVEPRYFADGIIRRKGLFPR
jgi:hypothetical protein